jgi:hypothetical protein
MWNSRAANESNGGQDFLSDKVRLERECVDTAPVGSDSHGEFAMEDSSESRTAPVGSYSHGEFAMEDSSESRTAPVGSYSHGEFAMEDLSEGRPGQLFSQGRPFSEFHHLVACATNELNAIYHEDLGRPQNSDSTYLNFFGTNSTVSCVGDGQEFGPSDLESVHDARSADRPFEANVHSTDMDTQEDHELQCRDTTADSCVMCGVAAEFVCRGNSEDGCSK